MRRSGEKQTGAVRPVGMLTDAALAVASTLRIDSVLQLLGWRIQPVNQPRSKKVFVNSCATAQWWSDLAQSLARCLLLTVMRRQAAC